MNKILSCVLLLMFFMNFSSANDKTFLEYCLEKDYSNSTAEEKNTINLLLEVAETSNCRLAYMRLKQTWHLDLSPKYDYNAPPSNNIDDRLFNLNVLRGLDNVRSIYFNYYGPHPFAEIDVSYLSEMKTFERLSISNAKIIGLKNLKSLKKLWLNDIENIKTEEISELINLTELYLASCGIDDISFVSTLLNLTSFNAHMNNITDISSLKHLENLRELSLDNNNISDASALSGLVNLKILYIFHNKLDDLKFIANLSHLEYLGLDDSLGFYFFKIGYLGVDTVFDKEGIEDLRVLVKKYHAI